MMVKSAPKFVSNTESKPKTSTKQEFTGQSVAELNEMLQAAIENEEYEKASRIRDELNRRNRIRK